MRQQPASVQQNLERLAVAGAAVRVCIPVISGFNDSEADYDAFAAYLGHLQKPDRRGGYSSFPCLRRQKIQTPWQVDSYQYRGTETLQPEDVRGLARKLKQAGFSPENNSLTVGGMTG